LQAIMASHRPIQFSLKTLLLAVALAATVLGLASWLGSEYFLVLSVGVLFPGVVIAGLAGWLFLENDVVHFGVLGGVIGFLFGFSGAGFGQSVLGGVLLGALAGDVLRDGRREPLFAGQWRRQRQWHLIARRDGVILARLGLAVACLAAFCPLVSFWIAGAVSPDGIDLTQVAGGFWQSVVGEVAWRQAVRPGTYLGDLLWMPAIANWHVIGMLTLCVVICIRLRRRDSEPPVVELSLAHVSTAFALAMLLLSSRLAHHIYDSGHHFSYLSREKIFFGLCFRFGLESAPAIILAPLAALALGPYRGRFLRNHMWLPALAAIGLLNVVLVLLLTGYTFGPLR
jgi:hypothetical protein